MQEVSVLMAVFNGEKYLKQAIDSILNQTFTNFELVILNDGSTDSSIQIINSYEDNRIKLFHNETNKGLIYTRNKLLNLANHNIVAIMDCDDVSFLNRFEKQLEFLNNNPDIILCGTQGEIIDANCNLVGIKILPEIDSKLINIQMLFKNQFIHSSVMYYKIIAQELGGYSSVDGCEDYGLFSKMSLRYKLGNINDVLIYYRDHSLGISKTDVNSISTGEQQIIEFLFERFKLVNKHKQLPFLVLKDQFYSTDSKLINSYFITLYEVNKANEFYNNKYFWKIVSEYWYIFSKTNKSKKMAISLLVFAIKNSLNLSNKIIRKSVEIILNPFN
jgi:glycosyltransferase involved in cell wall biosynthesis